ncbi:Granule-bound starch synthase 1 chloroplastic/amyloplastic, partial [Bienertia sinuspersici]
KKREKQQEIAPLLRCLLQHAKRSELSCELKASSSLSTPTSGTENIVVAIFNSKDKKKCQFPLYGRGVSSTLLKQKAMLEEAKKKNEEKMESLKKDYEDKRRQHKMELASGLQALLSQIQQQNPYMSFDLSIFGSLLLDDRSKKDVLSRRDSSKML